MSQLAFQFELGEQYGWLFLVSSHSTSAPVLFLKLHVPASVLYFLSDSTWTAQQKGCIFIARLHFSLQVHTNLISQLTNLP